MVDSLVTDGGLRLVLAYEILQVLLKALLAFQEAHGHIIICVAVTQLRQEAPEDRGTVSIRYIENRSRQSIFFKNCNRVIIFFISFDAFGMFLKSY